MHRATATLVLAATAALAAFAGGARADTISFTGWSQSGSDTVIPTFEVSDDTAGQFSFKIGINTALTPDANEFADITGIYLDWGIDPLANPYLSTDISNEVTPGISGFTDFAKDADGIGGVTELNLGDFNVVIGYKDGGDRVHLDWTNVATTDDYLTFDLAIRVVGGTPLTLEDFTKVGLRFQGVGAQGGSDKEVSLLWTKDGDPRIVTTPEPATMALLGAGLLGAAWKRRRLAAR